MHALSIKDLNKTYANGNVALQGINFSVEPGDFYALLGPNGAGKTTAIGIISSLVNKSGGSVEIFGHNIDTDLEAAKACLGLVPQEVNLNLFDTVLNIVVDRSSRRAGVARAMPTRAIADASGSAVDVVHLEVRASNTAARALYESLGFHVVGKRPRYYERREDAILMSLRLE